MTDENEITSLVHEIYGLRDKIYTNLNKKWTNTYGKDKFHEAMKHLNEAASELGLFY